MKRTIVCVPLLALAIPVLAGETKGVRIFDAKMFLGASPEKLYRHDDYDFIATYERDATVHGKVVLARPVAAKGSRFELRLTDSFDRLLKVQPVDLSGLKDPLTEIPFALNASNVRVMLHTLTAHVVASDSTIHVARSNLVFIPPETWDDYEIMNWHRPPINKLKGNWEIEVRGSQWNGKVPAPAFGLIRNNFRWYVEGTGAQFYAPYHLWRSTKDLDYLFHINKEQYKRDRSSVQPWHREPCLSDPWMHERIFKWFHNAARTNRLVRPYFYTVADEPGIANQAAPSDYCFSPWCQDAFRDWLDRKYGDDSTQAMQAGEILDWGAFLKRFSNRAGKQIHDRLSDELKKKVTDAKGNPGDALKAELTKAFNKVLRDRTFYDLKQWRKTHLCEEAQGLYRRGLDKLTEKERFRFNRLALQAAFPHTVSRSLKTLERVNKEWGTNHTSWSKLRALTTDETFARKGDNFAPWCDHKDFMDDKLIVDGYGRARRAVRSADKTGRVGGGGFQGPTGVGGWDYWKICNTLDVLEAYYIGNNYELIRSFKPDIIQVTMSGQPNDSTIHRLWYLMIHGDRGTIIWDATRKGERVVGDDLKPTKRGLALAKIYREFRGGIVTQRIYSQRDDDPIAYYESQPSLRVHWCLDVRPHGKNWINRGSWTERRNTTTYRLREAVMKLIEDNGLQFTVVCDQQVKAGVLKKYDPKTGTGFKAVVLPRVIAMSKEEAEAVRAFAKGGGVVVASGRPGLFSEHGRRLEKGLLDDLFGEKPAKDIVLVRGGADPTERELKVIDYHRQRLHDGEETAAKDFFGETLRAALGKDRRSPRLTDAEGKPHTGVEVTTWRNGQARMIAVHRNPQFRITELGEHKRDKSNARFQKPVDLTLEIDGACYDVRAGKLLGEAKKITFTLQPYEPKLFCVVPKALKPFTFKPAGPLVPGEAYKLILTPGEDCPLAKPVYHVEARAPDGKRLALYDQNVVVAENNKEVLVPFAINDKPGTWTIVATEAVTGQKVEVKVEVGEADQAAGVPTAKDAKVTKIADGFRFTEGPTPSPDGFIYFTDAMASRIHRIGPDGKVSLFRENTRGGNGMWMLKDNSLLICEGKGRRLVKLATDGKLEVLAEKYDGKHLNSPNDVWPDPSGGIYFTDPRYGRRGPPLEQDGEHVYYLTPKGKLVRVIDDMVRPNGIIGTPDGKTLYVTDHGASKTYAYEIRKDGTVTGKRQIAPEGSDGLTLDENGNLYLTNKVVSVFDRKGTRLGEIALPQKPTNVCFGGKDGRTLFITAPKAVYSIRMAVKGAWIYGP